MWQSPFTGVAVLGALAGEPITLGKSLWRLGKMRAYCVWKERLDRPIW